MAIVEPGVTFSELQPELAKEGMRLPMPLLPRTSKSVLGSVLGKGAYNESQVCLVTDRATAMP